MKNKYIFIIFAIMVLLLPYFSVDALSTVVPKSGYFECEYEIEYVDQVDKVNRTVSVELNGNSDELFKINYSWLDGECDLGVTNCQWHNLSYAINHSSHNGTGTTYASVQDAKLSVTDFVSSSGQTPNWTCPIISYNVEYKTINGVQQYYVEIGNKAANYSKTATAISNTSELAPVGDIKNVTLCTYSIQGSNFTGVLENNTMNFYIGSHKSSRSIAYSGGACPLKQNLTLCMSNNSSAFYVLNNNTNCADGFTAYNAEESSNPETDNSGTNTCCVYKTTTNEPIYIYKIARSLGNFRSVGGCIGYDCMTTELSSNINAAVINPNLLPDYHSNINNCNNMPQNIWYARVDGKIQFYASNEPSMNTSSATLSLNDSCNSDLVYQPPESNSDSNVNWGDQVEVNCEGIIGDELLGFINKIFRWIQILAPIFVIIMGSVEFAGAVLQDDKDALKKASSRFIKRLIIAVALFFIPLILSFILEIFNDITGASSSTCGIGE